MSNDEIRFCIYFCQSEIGYRIIPTSHRGVGIGPYSFQLAERAYSSVRPEAASCRAMKSLKKAGKIIHEDKQLILPALITA